MQRSFFLGEQGMLNFLIFCGVQKKELRVYSMPFHVTPGYSYTEEEVRLEYSPLCLSEKKPLKPAVLHYCLDKPDIFMPSIRSSTINHFRLRYLLQIEGLPRWKALWHLAAEDKQYVARARVLRKLLHLMKVKS